MLNILHCNKKAMNMFQINKSTLQFHILKICKTNSRINFKVLNSILINL